MAGDWFAQNAPKPAGGDWFAQNAPKAAAVETPAFKQPEGSAAGRLAKGVWDNTVGGIADMAQMLKDVIGGASRDPVLVQKSKDTLQGIVQAHYDQAVKAKEAWSRGDYSEAFGHGLATLPMIGPPAAAAGEKIGGTAPGFDRYGNVVKQGQAPDLAGGLGGAVGLVGAVAAPAAVKAVRKVLPESVRVTPKLTNPNPVEAAAVKWGMERNPAMVDAATATGSPAVKHTQAFLDRATLGGSIVGTKATRAKIEALTRTGAELAEEARPGPAVTPHQAATGVTERLQRNIQALDQQADVAYERLREIERDPFNMREVPTGKVDPQTQRPITEDMPLPVDMRPVKEALKPIYAKYERTLTKTKKNASEGLNAISNIINEGDFKPASIAEMDLGAIKEAARAEMPELRDISQGLAARAVSELDTAIREAVSQAQVDGFDGAAGGQNPALQSLLEGRQHTAQKWDVAGTLKSFGRKIEDLEPVQVFQQLTWGRDSGIQRLREVAKQAPYRMADVGRAYIEGLLDTATREGGFDKAQTVNNHWRELGPETKKILFKNPQLIESLDNFFLLAKKASENPNPSGTAYVGAIGAQGYLFTDPVTGVATQIGAAALSKFLHSPRGIAILTEGLRVPLGGSRATVAGNALTRLVEEQGGTPPPPEGGPPAPGGSGRPAPGGAPPGVRLADTSGGGDSHWHEYRVERDAWIGRNEKRIAGLRAKQFPNEDQSWRSLEGTDKEFLDILNEAARNGDRQAINDSLRQLREWHPGVDFEVSLPRPAAPSTGRTIDVSGAHAAGRKAPQPGQVNKRGTLGGLGL